MPRPGPTDTALPLALESRGDWTVATLTEASMMDVGLIESLHAKVLELAGDGAKNLALDFSRVEYVSSSMFGVLVASREAIGKGGGRLVLCALNERLAKLLKLARLDQLFECVASVDEVAPSSKS